ncbi:MAG: GTPase HflX [Phycisphaerales bacterium]|nr:GTPase HflX [Planctomycetota bacterium]MCH8507321.1 GTPase HflX [Phycisphaerales bacterium]
MPNPTERQNIQVRSERTVLAALRLPESVFDPRDPFGELRELAEQAGATVVGELEQRRDRPEPGTYMGKGKVEELKALCDALDATTVIFDHELSPKQIATIEKIVGRKILDRSELILDIFAGRATSHEAQLQVELAQLEYTYPRLRAMWSHLERISAGAASGGVGTRGPGEQQLEIDRRLVQRRKIQLQRELAEIQDRKRRAVRQRNIDNDTVGLVGYTNAGKSTLFNTMTEGGAYADDRVFATLSTRTRRWDLGGGVNCMLSDTVGFVRELPHHLVASFRATLEEATHADLLIVVLDVSDPSVEMHHDTVMRTLEELFEDVEKRESRDKDAPPYERPELITILNKADRLGDNRDVLYWQARIPGSIPLCALPPGPDRPEPVGQTELTERIRAFVIGPIRELDLSLPMADAKTIDIIERRCEILDRRYEGDRAILRARLGARQLNRLRSLAADLEAYTPDGERLERETTKAGWRR